MPGLAGTFFYPGKFHANLINCDNCDNTHWLKNYSFNKCKWRDYATCHTFGTLFNATFDHIQAQESSDKISDRKNSAGNRKIQQPEW